MAEIGAIARPGKGHPPDRARAIDLRSMFRDRRLQRIVVWGGLLLAWQIFGTIRGPFFFASFTATIDGFFQLLFDGDLFVVLGSFGQLLIGYALAIVVGIPVGLILGGSRLGEALIGHYVNALFVTSLEALLPFVIILFGVELQYRVAVVFLFAVLYVTINTAAGVASVDPNLVETARSFGAGRLRMARGVVLPSIVPYVFAGLRLGFGFAVKGMVIAELWVITGTGALLVDLGLNRYLDRYFALALVIITIGVVGTWLIKRCQLLVAPWSEITRGQRGLR